MKSFSSSRRSLLSVLAVSLWLIFASSSPARINVVTLPARDTVQLTIYNSADLTMVKETRTLTFRKGLNKLEFSWANTLIDPTSVEFHALTHADQVEVLDVSFPPRVTNTLEWRINSEMSGEVVCEIRYFTSGISWSADYVAEANKAEKLMTLAGSVRINNNSGEDYDNAQVRLVVGVIRLVEEIRQLAQQGRPGQPQVRDVSESDEVTKIPAAPMAMAQALGMAGGRPHEIIKEGVSEYFLYTVEGRDTIPTGWSKRLPSFKTAEVPFGSYYKYERERTGDQVVRYYRFKNDKESKLGDEPLPDGSVMAFRNVTPDNLYQFVGRTAVKYIPIGEQVEMDLGNDREVLVKPTLMDWQKNDIAFDQWGGVAGWTIKETWQVEVQNSKDIDVVLDIRRNFASDWEIQTEAKFEKVDATKVKFVLPLKSREKKTFIYEVTTRYGKNIKK